MSKIQGIVKTLRPPVGVGALVVAAASAVWASVESTGGPPDLSRLLWGLLATWFGTTAGYAVNDYFDAEVDGRLFPDRAIPSGDLVRGQVLALGLLLGIASMIICVAVFSWRVLACGLVGVLIITAYSAYFKARTPYSFVLVVLSVCFMPLAMWVAFASLSPTVVWLVLVYLCFEPGFTLAGVCRDMEGDTSLGVPTFPVRRGIRATAKVILFSWGATALACMAMFLFTDRGPLFLILALAGSAWVLYLGTRLLARPEPEMGGSVFLKSAVFFWAFNLAIVGDLLI